MIKCTNPNCQAEMPAGAKFCGECGASIALSCTNCGAEMAPSAKFCAECGTSVSGAPSSTTGENAHQVPDPTIPLSLRTSVERALLTSETLCPVGYIEYFWNGSFVDKRKGGINDRSNPFEIANHESGSLTWKVYHRRHRDVLSEGGLTVSLSCTDKDFVKLSGHSLYLSVGFDFDGYFKEAKPSYRLEKCLRLY